MRRGDVETRAFLQQNRNNFGAQRARQLRTIILEVILRFLQSDKGSLKVCTDSLARIAPKMRIFDTKISRNARDFRDFSRHFSSEQAQKLRAIARRHGG